MTSSFWKTFSAAPHRMMMFGGAVQLLLTMLYWSAELLGRHTGLWQPLNTSIPGMFAHGFLMIFLLFPFFIFGFLMTTYPRWMRGEQVSRNLYQSSFLLLSGGTILFYSGLLWSRYLLIAAVALALLGYTVAIYALIKVYRHAPSGPRFYERLLNIALSAGVTALSAYLLWLITFEAVYWRLSIHIGLWVFLLPIIVIVCHRMLPFFGAIVLPEYSMHQPRGSLLAILILLGLHGALEVLQRIEWLWLTDLPLLALALHLSWRWGFKRSFANRLLAILHVAFAWLSIALALYVADSLFLFSFGTSVLGRAPLHAITIGFIASVTLAMASRVTLGHSGHELRADTTTWVLFWGISLVAILRIVGELPRSAHFNWVAALFWLMIAAVWSAKYARIYLQPRLDGQPG